MNGELRPLQRLGELAARQHGVISFEQLRQLGFSAGRVQREATAGRLHRIHRGVFAVGHPGLSRHGRCLGAVLACGPGAHLSHRSAGWLWGLIGPFPAPPEVTRLWRGHRTEAIRVHHSTILDQADHATCDEVPVTAVPRTLLDLAAQMRTRDVERTLERAERLGLLDLPAIDSLLKRSGGHTGRARLKSALGIYRDASFTRARSERLFMAIIKRAGLPRPAMNTFVAGYELDAYWPALRFAVEIDGFESHGTRAAFERDPVRVEDLKLAGIDAIRITAKRIENEPDRVGESLRALLTQRAEHLRRARGS